MIEASAPAPNEGLRPTEKLGIGELLRISLYWLGLSSIFAGLTSIISGRLQFDHLVETGSEGSALFGLNVAGALIAAIVQPTVGAISDYTSTRWGRRKPYIIIGSVFDALFLLGLAMSSNLLAIAALIVLLQLSSNTAQGPFQGYIPDLVPEKQVGTASSLVGLMQVFGNVAGFGVGAIAVATSQFGLGLVALAMIELVTMTSVVIGVRAGPPPRQREGRSWLQIAREAWGTDILRERSYVWLVASRWFVLIGGSMLINFATFYLAQTMRFSQVETGQAQMALLGVTIAANLVAVVPAGKIGDRIGRKKVIWIACAMAGVGMVIAALAPSFPVALVGGALFGMGLGSFIAVDWALLTSLVPAASSGRYMGVSNVATATSGITAVMTGGLLMDVVNRAAGYGSGPRAAFLLAVVSLAIGALLLVKVHEPPREHPGG